MAGMRRSTRAPRSYYPSVIEMVVAPVTKHHLKGGR